MVSPCSDEISAALERAELFAQLSQAGRHRLAGALTVTTLGAGEALFRYGETGDSLFIVAAGRLEVLVESGQDGGRPLGHIERYQCVGEMALLATNARRTATVKALEDSRLLELSRQAFEQLLAAEPSLRRLIGEVLLRRLPGLHLATSRLFGDLDPPLLEELQSHFFWVSLNRGEVLFRQEDPAEAVYYVVN